MTPHNASPAARSAPAGRGSGAAEHARPLGLRFIVAVTNEPWQDHDAARTAERWATLCAEHGDPGLGAAVTHGPALHDAVAEIRALFSETAPYAAARTLNAALAAAGCPPELVQLPDGRWATSPSLPSDAPAATVYGTLAAAALADWFAERGRPAWGHCAAARCDQVFLDEGRRAPQRFCSPSCATRTRVAAHRLSTAG